MIAVTEALNNVQTLELPDPLEAEKEIIVPLTEKYNLKVRFDAFYWNYILDHKTVATFTPEEKVEEKYGQQMRLYQYARYKYSGEKLPIYIQEVKKARASIPQEYSKKEDLLTLVPEEKREELIHSRNGAEKGLSLPGLMRSFLRWKISSGERWSRRTICRLYH